MKFICNQDNKPVIAINFIISTSPIRHKQGLDNRTTAPEPLHACMHSHAAYLRECIDAFNYNRVDIELALLVSTIDSIWDSVMLFEGCHVFFRQPCPGHLIANGHPVVVQVVLAPKDLQIPPCKQAYAHFRQ